MNHPPINYIAHARQAVHYKTLQATPQTTGSDREESQRVRLVLKDYSSVTTRSRVYTQNWHGLGYIAERLMLSEHDVIVTASVESTVTCFG